MIDEARLEELERAPRTETPVRERVSAESIGSIEPVLYGYALRSVRNRSLAEDLVHDTYVAALENQDRFEGRSTLRSWMVGILGRKIVDHYRKHRREQLDGTTPEPEPEALLSPAEPMSAEQWIDTRRALRLVGEGMETLTELERNAVHLCDIELIDRAEAAATLGVEATHLRVLLHRGRAKLREILEEHDARIIG